MSLINISNLSFSYDNNHDIIFKNINFKIDTDWKLGFIGRNGKGKTTFLKILQGKYNYSGTILSSVTFEYFPYKIKNENLNALGVLKEICPNHKKWEFLRELSLLEVKENIIFHPFYLLSGGEQTKVLLAALFLKENNFLLIDEPTNHLDENSRKIVGNYLKSKKGFILVSHDRNLIDSCVDHILSINKVNIEIQKGNFSTWEENKRRQDELEIRQNEKLKKEIKRLKRAVEKTAIWSDKIERSKNRIDEKKSIGYVDKGYIGASSSKMMKRSKSIEKRSGRFIEEKNRLLHNVDIDENLKIYPLEHHSKKIIEFEGISLFYNNKKICGNLNFTIEQGDRISLKGKNGSGKSTILKLIIGENIKYTGNFYCAKNLKISYVEQEILKQEGNIFEYIEKKRIDKTLFFGILRKMGFARSQFEKNISDFSEGQKKKVLIATSLCEKAHLYVWDEPLNYIDILSRVQIEKLILEYRPTLIFVEHDSIFSQKIANKIISIDL